MKFLRISEIEELVGELDTPFNLTSVTYYAKILTSRKNLFSIMLVSLALHQNIYSSAIIIDSSYIYFNSSSNLSDDQLEVWNVLENITIETIVSSGIINVTTVTKCIINKNITLPIDEEVIIENVTIGGMYYTVTIPTNQTIMISVEINVM